MKKTFILFFCLSDEKEIEALALYRNGKTFLGNYKLLDSKSFDFNTKRYIADPGYSVKTIKLNENEEKKILNRKFNSKKNLKLIKEKWPEIFI